MNRGMKFLACVALGLIAAFAFGWVTMALWNWLVPSLFGGPAVTFWQALGLLLLSKILFWGFGGGGKHGCGTCGSYGGGHWKDKYKNMTPEERAALKQKMKEKWCHWDENASSKGSEASNG
jgi:hypothetical protein